jgi:regulator of protease activity HflC (stomatin/prohibitin superfamily)
MEFTLIFVIAIAIVSIVVLSRTIRIVPQNQAYIVERLGKYITTLEAGLHILIPFIDRVTYRHSLKELAFDVPAQQAITKDNVSLGIDGVLYLRIMDPKAASYGVEHLQFAVIQLAQTSMRAEIGKLTLDETFESRENINDAITQAIDVASNAWGTKVLRYEVRDISPPQSILEEMEKQMAAERERRVAVTTSEGYRTAQINNAEGDKQAKILRAQGDAQSIEIEAKARAAAILNIADAIKNGGEAAVAQQLSEQYITAFEKLAKTSTVTLIPSDVADVSSIVAKAFTAFNTLKENVKDTAHHEGASQR